MNQEWLLIDPMVELLEQIEEGVEFAEAANIPILGGKVINIAYLLILSTGRVEKECEQWEDMQVGLKTWQVFKDHFEQACRRYKILIKATAVAHEYGESSNHTQDTEAQFNTAVAWKLPKLSLALELGSETM